MNPNWSSWSLVLPCTLGTLMAQIGPLPQAGQQPRGNPSAGAASQGAAARQTTGDPDLDALTPVWSQPLRPAPFQGFPIFPAQLPGYGSFPRSVELPKGNLGELFRGLSVSGLSQLPVGQTPAETGWPAWARTQSLEPLPYEPEAALLVRNVDRVWWRPPEEEVLVPLYFHDKLRTIRKGTEIAIRKVGAFEILWHGGGRLDAQGITALGLDGMDEKVVDVTVRELTHIRLEGYGREFRVHLPDGSHLVLPPEVAPAPSVPPPIESPFAALLPPNPAAAGSAAADALAVNPWNPARIEIERADEPGRRAGRATVWNSGQIAVQWHHAGGETRIAPGERVALFLSPTASGIGRALQANGAAVRSSGEGCVCRAEQPTAVEWSGARFHLPAGGELRFDPLQGAPFAPQQ